MRMKTILSISLHAALRAALDTEAKRQRRSRSFIVGEAIREYVTHQERDAFTTARDRTLREGLALAPADRLRVAEELWHELAPGRTPAQAWTAAFDTFDQYDRWRRQGGGGAG